MKSTSIQAAAFRVILQLSALSLIENHPFLYRKLYRIQFFLNKTTKLKNKYIRKYNLTNESKERQLYKLERNRAYSARKVIFYIHGGAFTINITDAHFKFNQKLADSLTESVSIYFPIYSLAPNKQFSTIFEECLDCYRLVVKEHPNEKIYIMGDSAGGMLALNLINYLQHMNEPHPSKAVLISPFLDGYFNTPVNHYLQKRDKMLGLGYLKLIAENLDNLKDNPYLSLNCFSFDYASFPKILLIGGEDELFASAYYRFIRQMNESHPGKLKSSLGLNMQHISTLFQFIPESQKSFLEILDFIRD